MFLEIPEILRTMKPSSFGNSIEALQEALPSAFLQDLLNNKRIKWRTERGAGGSGKVAYAVLKHDEDTGEVIVLGAIENGAAVRHVHFGGEIIYTLAGEGHDIDFDSGEEVILRPGSILAHQPDTIHAPSSPGFWVFYYVQPHGMHVLED